MLTVFPIAGSVLALAIKLLGVTALSRRLRSEGSWLAAWLVVQAAMTGTFLLLSPFNAITPAVTWALLIAAAAISVFSLRSIPLPAISPAGCVVAAIVLALMIRANFNNDPTADGQTYGLVRIAWWMNRGSLLPFMPTENFNMFTNEWNGELNGLLYGLAAGNVQGFGFGNIEILIVTYLALQFLIRQLGGQSVLAPAFALVLAGSPALIALATTTKGDLLACTAIVMGAGFALAYRGKPAEHIYLTLTLASLGLAVGAKITSIFAALAVLSLLIKPVRSDWRGALGYAVPGVVAACMFTARYFINIVQYGGPLSRAGGETMHPSLTTLLSNISLTARQFVQRFVAEPQQLDSLCAGLCISGILILLISPFGFRTIGSRKQLFIAGAVAWLVTITLVGSYPFSFRYFLPAILLAVVPVLASASLSRPFRRFPMAVIAACLIAVAGNSWAFVPPNSIVLTGGRSFYNALLYASPLTRSTLPWPYFIHDAHIKDLDLDHPDAPKTIAIFAPLASVMFVFSGSWAQNRIIMSDTMAGFETLIKDARPDFAVIVKAREPERKASATELATLARAGCGKRFDDNWYTIAKCAVDD